MTKRFIDVSYEDRELAKRLGARWDPAVKRWYYPKGSNLAKIFGWRAAPAKNANENQPVDQAIAPKIVDQFMGDLFEQASTRYG